MFAVFWLSTMRALIRWSVAQTLGDQGFEVEQASSAREALDVVAACQGRFDVVAPRFPPARFERLDTPGRLRQLLPESTVILMTAFSTPEVMHGALELGADASWSQALRNE